MESNDVVIPSLEFDVEVYTSDAMVEDDLRSWVI